MVNCPLCDAVIDVDEEELDEGDALICEECGANLAVSGVSPLELKSEKDKHLTFADCENFVPQAASYAIGSGKRIAVLCVLDGSPKTKTAFPMEDGIGVFVHRTSETPVYVLTILIQGNLARPSAFSR